MLLPLLARIVVIIVSDCLMDGISGALEVHVDDLRLLLLLRPLLAPLVEAVTGGREALLILEMAVLRAGSDLAGADSGDGLWMPRDGG